MRLTVGVVQRFGLCLKRFEVLVTEGPRTRRSLVGDFLKIAAAKTGERRSIKFGVSTLLWVLACPSVVEVWWLSPAPWLPHGGSGLRKELDGIRGLS